MDARYLAYAEESCALGTLASTIGMKQNISDDSPRIGVLEHTGPSIGGGTMVAAHLASLLSRSHSVDLIRDWSGFSVEQVSSAFSLDLSNVRARGFDGIWESFAVPGRYSLRQQIERSRALTAEYDLFIYAGHWIPPFCFARHGLIYCHFPIHVPLDQEFVADDPRWKRRNWLDRWIRTKAYLLGWRARLNGYDRIFANSAFTAGWIRERWNTNAEVLYPPIELNVPSVEKQNRIVSIGRFVGGERGGKGHLAQVEALRDFHAQVKEPWELWMIGSCFPERDRSYLSRIQEAARGLPIRLLTNVDRNTVLEALAGAKLFWHTAGLAESSGADPVFSEHFGMATVEAMRSGCVPIVISSGGQREIVRNGVDGFLCKDVGELVTNSVSVAENSRRLAAVSREAISRSEDFSGRVFDTRVLEVVRQTMSAKSKGWSTRALGAIAGKQTSSRRSQEAHNPAGGLISPSEEMEDSAERELARSKTHAEIE